MSDPAAPRGTDVPARAGAGSRRWHGAAAGAVCLAAPRDAARAEPLAPLLAAALALMLPWAAVRAQGATVPTPAHLTATNESSPTAKAWRPPAALRIRGDAIPEPLTAEPGDAARGRAIVANRQVGLCLLCHTGPFPEERFQGNLAPDLSGAGGRWSAGQLRLRIADSRQLQPDTLMPAYHRIDGLERVGRAWQGQAILSAQQVEDVVAFLQTLRP
jgi:sulfur-oxidizing protein SoxX